MVVKVCVLELQLLCLAPGAVDTKVTDLWSFIPSYNHRSHVSLMPSSTLVVQRAKISYLANRAVRGPWLSTALSQCGNETGESFLVGWERPVGSQWHFSFRPWFCRAGASTQSLRFPRASMWVPPSRNQGPEVTLSSMVIVLFVVTELVCADTFKPG